MSRSKVSFLALTALAAAGLVCSAAPAHGQVRLSRDTGGDFNVAVMSWWEIPFRSVVRQQHDFSCGSAAIATLLSYHYDRPTPERVAFSQMWQSGDRETIRKVGFSMLDMKSYLSSIGYRAEGLRLSVDKLEVLERPVIVMLDMKGFKHFVVVKGVRGDRVLVGDPMLGLTQYSLSDFAAMWNNIVLVVMDTPNSTKARYDLAGDWGPWSQAPREDDGAMRVAIGDLTTFLPPKYQLSPEILLDVHVGTVK